MIRLLGGWSPLGNLYKDPGLLSNHPQFLFWVRGSKLSWIFWHFKPKTSTVFLEHFWLLFVVLFQALKVLGGPSTLPCVLLVCILLFFGGVCVLTLKIPPTVPWRCRFGGPLERESIVFPCDTNFRASLS